MPDPTIADHIGAALAPSDVSQWMPPLNQGGTAHIRGAVRDLSDAADALLDWAREVKLTRPQKDALADLRDAVRSAQIAVERAL